MPIDFGRSYVGRAFTSLEVRSLVRTLAPSFGVVVGIEF